MPARSYRRVAPVGFSRVDAERRRFAARGGRTRRTRGAAAPAPSPRFRHGLRTPMRADPAGARPGRRSQRSTAAISSPSRTMNHRVGSKSGAFTRRLAHSSNGIGTKFHSSSNASSSAAWKRLRVVGLERVDVEILPATPARGGAPVELDQHAVVAAHLAKPTPLEEPSRRVSSARKTTRSCELREPSSRARSSPLDERASSRARGPVLAGGRSRRARASRRARRATPYAATSPPSCSTSPRVAARDPASRHQSEQLGLGRVGPALDRVVGGDDELVDRRRVLAVAAPDAEALRQGRAHRACPAARDRSAKLARRRRLVRARRAVDPDGRQAELVRRDDVVEVALRRRGRARSARPTVSSKNRCQCPCAGL